MNSYHLFLSNRVETLADELSRRLFSQMSDPFAEKIVIIQDEEIRFFLMRHFAKNPERNVAFGIRFYTLANAFSALIGDQAGKLVSSMELSLHIEHEIYKLPRDEKVLEPLFRYSGDQPGKRITELAQQLATLFTRYGTYGGEALAEWEKKEGWQQYLWRRLFSSGLTVPYRVCTHKPVITGPLHLFALSFIPKVYLELLRKLPCTHYLLSPCETFWQDMATEKERIYLQKVNPALDSYLRDRHPLLASLGKYGRQFLRQIDELEPELDEHYREAEEETALTKLQDELRANVPGEILLDDSIQVHGAPTRWREMEVLRDFLYQELNNGVPPSEIVILAPDIAAYAPYIHAVFGPSADRLAYSIHDLPLSSDSLLAAALQHLLALPEERFEMEAVFKLFLFEPFCQKWKLAPAEIAKIRNWIEEARVRRDEHWEEAFERLLLGLAQFPTDEDPVPLSLVEMSEAPLLGTFITMVRSLREKLTLCEKKMTYSEWFVCLRMLLETFFIIDEDDPFWRELGAWTQKLRHLRETPVPFASIERILKMIWQKPQGAFLAPHLQRILFCSLRPAATLPAQVICIIGMDEGIFPRIERRCALDELSGILSDYCPTSSDQDRYLFLEQILCARKKLWISFQSRDEKDEKPKLPSLVVQELMSYLNCEAVHHPFHFSQSEKENKPFFPHFYEKCEEPVTSQESIQIDVRNLAACARHPIKFYLEKALGLYLKDEREEDSEEFVLSPLQKAPLRRASLHMPLSKLLDVAHAKKILPVGAFKDVATAEIQKDIAEYHEKLEAFSIRPNEVFSVELSPHCAAPKQLSPQHWIVPAVRTPHALISGKLTDLTPRGFLVHGENTVRDLVKAWPQFLLATSLGLPIEPCILFTKDGESVEFSDLTGALDNYLLYFKRALVQASPLLPDWAEAFLRKGSDDLAKAMQRSLSFQEDRIIQWLAARDPIPSAEFLHEQWSPYFRRIYDKL